MLAGISPGEAILADTDCYFYYYSSCGKGDSCPYRHEPSALGKEIVCEHWLKGNCNKKICPFRHMKITKKREVIPCHHENKPGGCTKPHCPFLHGTELKKRDEVPCIHESRPGGCTKHECPFLHINNRKSPISANGRGDNASSPRNSKNGTSEQLRNLSLSPRGRDHIFQDKSMKIKEKFKGRTRQAVSLGNLSKPETEHVRPNDLVSCLSKERNFSVKFRILCMTLKCKEAQAKQTVFTYNRIFVARNDTVMLRPKLKICHKYTTDVGCDGIRECVNLHVCPMFVFNNCNSSSCVLGHVLKTNHNKIIYEQYHVGDLSTFTLLNLMRTIGPSVWAMKDNVKICDDYNEGNCSDGSCRLLHFCVAFLANQCLGDDECKLNHDISEGSIRTILVSHGVNSNESPKDIIATITTGSVVKDQIKYFLLSDNSNSHTTIRTESVIQMRKNSKDNQEISNITVWSHHYLGESSQTEICFDSVEGLCQLEESACPKLHSTQHYHWQVKEEGQKWVNLRSEQVTALEKAYCDPEATEVDLPPLDPTTLDSSVKGLITMMQGRKKWKANFDTMQMSLSGSKSLSLRRLFTKTISGGTTPDPCRYTWYFFDSNNAWIEYGNIDSSGDANHKCSCNSGDLEKHFQQTKDEPMIVSTSKFSYSLDFVNMLQTNVATGVHRKMKRRPKPHLIVENTSWPQNEFPSYWESMQPQERAKRVKLNPNSEEYSRILSHYQIKGGTGSVLKIERVQNPYLWRTFQNKVREMMSIYNSKDTVNIQQLFHGTNANVVDNICKENFDWRLHGSSVGQAFGRGTYFSPFASTAYGYASPDSFGYKYMFVAQVVVGTIIRGNSSMVRPPLNPLTNVLYDSSVDRVSGPSKIVKYDKQEYFPEYIITIL